MISEHYFAIVVPGTQSIHDRSVQVIDSFVLESGLHMSCSGHLTSRFFIPDPHVEEQGDHGVNTHSMHGFCWHSSKRMKSDSIYDLIIWMVFYLITRFDVIMFEVGTQSVFDKSKCSRLVVTHIAYSRRLPPSQRTEHLTYSNLPLFLLSIVLFLFKLF